MLAIVAPAVFVRRLAAAREGRRPDDVVSARTGRRRRVLRADAVEAPAGGGGRGARRLAGDVPPLRDRLRRRDREQPPGARRGRSLLLPRSSSRSRARRGGRRADADVVHAHWLPSALRGAGDRQAVRAPALGLRRRARAARAGGSSGRSSGGRGSSSAPRRRSPTTPRARRARSARDPERRRRSPSRSASPTSRRTSSTSAGSPRRRASSSSSRRRDGLPLVVVGDGPLRDRVPDAVGFVPPRRARPVLRARRGRRRPVAPRGLRHGRARGDGVRATGRRDRGRRARGRGRGRRHGVARSGRRQRRTPRGADHASRERRAPGAARRGCCDAHRRRLLARRTGRGSRRRIRRRARASSRPTARRVERLSMVDATRSFASGRGLGVSAMLVASVRCPAPEAHGAGGPA